MKNDEDKMLIQAIIFVSAILLIMGILIFLWIGLILRLNIAFPILILTKGIITIIMFPVLIYNISKLIITNRGSKGFKIRMVNAIWSGMLFISMLVSSYLSVQIR